MKKLILIAILLFNFGCSNDKDCIQGNCDNGIGTRIYHDETEYTGKFRNGTRDGQGTYTLTNGDQLEGRWKDGLPDFEITKLFTDGTSQKMMWRDGLDLCEEEGRFCYPRIRTAADDKRMKEKEVEREKEEAREFGKRFEAMREHDRIYNACLLDKGPDVDMQVNALRKAVEETCEDIAWNPSWYESWKYD